MESVQKITEGFESLLTDRNKKKLAGYMQKLGFEDISAMFYKLNPETGRKVVNQLSTALLPPTLPWKHNTLESTADEKIWFPLFLFVLFFLLRIWLAQY